LLGFDKEKQFISQPYDWQFSFVVEWVEFPWLSNGKLQLPISLNCKLNPLQAIAIVDNDASSTF